MKKKGFKLSLKIFAIFLALCAITLYLPNIMLSASASAPDDTVKAKIKSEPDALDETNSVIRELAESLVYTEVNTELETESSCMASETEYIFLEESESNTEMEIIGGMVEIQPPDETAAEIQVAPDITVIVKEDGDGYYIEDGIYAFENRGNSGDSRFWLDIQQDKYLPGYHMQQYSSSTNPAVSFDRSCLFKITRRVNTNTYIIRSMLNNRLTFSFSGNEVLTKEIPPEDVNVEDADTFVLDFDISSGTFRIKPYGSNYIVAANNTTASGAAGAPNSYLKKSTNAAAGSQGMWRIYEYVGGTQSGVSPVFSPSTTSGSLIEGKTYSIKLVTWTTEIGKNTPYAMIHPDTPGMATATWNESTCTLTLTTEKSGPFKIRSIIRTDGTTTAFRSYYGNYPIVPDIVGDTAFVENVGTGRYIDVKGPNMNEGTIIHQWNFGNRNQSKWIFELKSGGYFAIKSKYSSKYIGVDSTDTTKVCQYGTQSDYTLWRIVSTSSGKYKLICKALESSGLVLAVPLNTNNNGTNLTMITYTENDNYRDEWYITNASVYIEFRYDYGFVDVNNTSSESIAHASTYISNNIVSDFFVEVHGAFAQIFNLNIVLSQTPPQLYESDADLCDTSINVNCNCISESSCLLQFHYDPNENNSDDGFTHNAHCKSLIRIRNNLITDIPDNTIRVAYTGHDTCFYSSGNHDYNTVLGLSDYNYPVIALKQLQNNRKRSILVLIHEISHSYGVTVHHNDNNLPETPCVMYSRYSMNNLDDYGTFWCQDCIDIIKEHIDKY